MEDCTKAIELKPDSAFSYNTRGLAKKAKGDTANHRRFHQSHRTRARRRVRLQKPRRRGKSQPYVDKAIADYGKAVELKPDFFEARKERDEVEKMK